MLMAVILDDDGKTVRVEESRTTVYFEMPCLESIIPALHFFDAFPESRGKSVVAISSANNGEEGILPTAEDTFFKYKTDNRFLLQGMDHSNDAYNLVLLSKDKKHNARDVLAEYAQFLQENHILETRKLLIREFSPEDAYLLFRPAMLRKRLGDKRLDFSVFWNPDSFNDGQPVPDTMYFHSARYYEIMRKLLTRMSSEYPANPESSPPPQMRIKGFKESNLSDRIFI